MRVTISLLGAVGGVFVVAACGEILSTGDAPPTTPAADGAVNESMDSASNPSPTDDSGPPACMEIQLSPTADTCLLECGSNSYGVAGYCNIKVGPLLASFDLDPAAAKDLREGRVKKLTLTLADNRTCDGTNCNVSPAAGELTAHVATNDWVEGAANAGYVGANACRRNAGKDSDNPPARGWGSNGATPSNATKISTPADFSSEVGKAAITGPEITSLLIALDPGAVAFHWATYAPKGDSGAETNRLSILVRAPSGTMTVGTRESKISAPAKLTICR